MKKLTTLSFAMLAAAALSSPAFADDVTVDTMNDTDLILAFRVDDGTGTGANTDLEVNLGETSQFTSGATITSFPGLTLNDLSNTYGSNFYSRGDLVFDAAGDTVVDGGEPANYGAASALVTESAYPAPQGDKKTFTTSSGALGEIVNETSALANTTALGDSGDLAGLVGNDTTHASAITGSLTYEAATGQNSTLEYNYFTENGSGVANTEAIVSGAVTELPLYEFDFTSNNSTPAPTLLGDFFLTSGGQLSYVGVDAPEPSTWAMMLGGLGLLLLAVRRRWISMLS